VTSPDSLIEPLVDDGLGNSSYLVDVGAGRALALDPSRHPGPYLQRAEQRGLSIAYTVETHLHADFVSGSRELAALGAQVVAPAAARLEFPARGLAHGDEVDLGADSRCGHSPPRDTRRSTFPICWSTTRHQSRCSRAGRCSSAPSPAPT
jgi:glyoxylase-like metal-dependent hydrolase (beta-lactamase superfamily II)